MSNDFNNLYVFGEYRLNCRERNLWRENEIIPLTPKLFETLKMLVENYGETLGKEEMLQTIWSDSFVEESNLTQNIYTLRQIFGRENKFIETVPRKGYRFIEPVSIENEDSLENQNHTKIGVLSEQVDIAQNDQQIVIESAPANARPSYKRYYQKALIALGILLSAVVGLLIYSFFPFQNSESDELSISSIELKSITDTGSSQSPAISSNGDFVVYVDERSDGKSLRLHDSASGGSLDIEISGSIQPGFVKFSRDDRELFFRAHGRVRSGQKIYRVSYFGGEPQPVAENTWGKFDLSPDGNSITYFRNDKAINKDVLLIKDLTTGEERHLVELNSPRLFFLPVAPAWSHDGRKIAFLLRPLSGHRNRIMVADVESGNVEEIDTELSKIFQIAWHSNNKDIYSISKEIDKGRQIFLVEYPTGITKRITNDFNDYEGLSISADNKYIVSESRNFQSNLWVYRQDKDKNNIASELTTGSYGHHSLAVLKFATEDRIVYDARNELERDLWEMSLSSGGKNRLTRNDGSRNVDISTTADGKYIYLSSNRSGIDNIWRMNQDGTDPVQITSAKDEVHWLPTLSYDEKFIYYLARTASQNELRRLDIESKEEKTIYVANDFVPGHFIEATADGKYLAFALLKQDNQTDEPGESDSLDNLKIGFLDLDNTQNLIKTSVRTSRARIRLTNGGKSFDYIRANEIVRKHLGDLNAEPEPIFKIEGEKIYNFDWSMSGLDLVVSRGNQRSNIVLIALK